LKEQVVEQLTKFQKDKLPALLVAKPGVGAEPVPHNRAHRDFDTAAAQFPVEDDPGPEAVEGIGHNHQG